MIGNMADFLSYLDNYNDVAKADRFQVKLNPPFALQGKYNYITSELALQCEEAELPGRTLATFDARTYGPVMKFPYQGVYNDLNLTFFCMANRVGAQGNSFNGNGLLEKVFFDDWMEVINPTPDSQSKQLFSIEYKDQYKTDIIVEHFDTMGALTYSVKFIDAFPLATNQLSLAWQNDSILRQIVTFAYTRWERDQSGSNPFNGGQLTTAQ